MKELKIKWIGDKPERKSWIKYMMLKSGVGDLESWGYWYKRLYNNRRERP